MQSIGHIANNVDLLCRVCVAVVRCWCWSSSYYPVGPGRGQHDRRNDVPCDAHSPAAIWQPATSALASDFVVAVRKSGVCSLLSREAEDDATAGPTIGLPATS